MIANLVNSTSSLALIWVEETRLSSCIIVNLVDSMSSKAAHRGEKAKQPNLTTRDYKVLQKKTSKLSDRGSDITKLTSR